MKETEDKNTKQFVDKIMKETSLESPSHDFTSKVMANVLAIGKSNVTVYKPLISKRGWLVIFGGIIATVIYLLTNNVTQSEGQPWSAAFSGRGLIKALTDLHLFQFSGITINIIVLSTLLMFIQITLLKNHLNKRLEK